MGWGVGGVGEGLMGDVGKALEDAASAAYEILADGMRPGSNTRASVASRAAVLAFLRAMPEDRAYDPPFLIAAIEKETAP